MNFTPVDESIRIALDAIERNPITHLKFQDYNKRDRYLNELLLQSLLNKERILILSDNSNLKEDILKSLSTRKLSSLCLNFDSQKDLTESIFFRIKAIGKSSLKSDNRVVNQFNADKEKIEDLTKELKRTYKQHISHFEDRPSTLETINQTLLIKDKSRSIKNSVDINVKVLGKLSKFYQKSFDILEKGDPFKQNFYKQIGLEEQTIPKVRYFNEEIKKLKREYRLLEISISKDYQNKLDAQYTENEKLAEALYSFNTGLEVLERSTNKGLVGKIFDKNKNPNWDSIKPQFEKLSKNLDFESASINSSSINALLNYWKKEKEVFFKNKELELRALISQLNCRNTDSLELKQFNEKLNDLANKMNDSGYFTRTIENNAWNFNGQYNTIKLINQILGSAIYLLDNPEYVYWRIVINELTPIQRESLNELKGFNTKDWIEVYNDSRVLKNLETIYRSELPDSKAIIDLSEKINKASINLSTYVEHSFVTLRTSKLKQLDKEHKHLYNKLLRKKNIEAVKWSDILESHESFLTFIFPIMICDSEFLEIENNYSWDKIVLIDTTTPLPIDKLTRLSSTIINLNEKSIFDENLDSSPDHKVEIKGKLANISNVVASLEHKINTSKIIADQIRDYAQNLKFFQAKNMVLISLLSNEKNMSILSENKELKFKEITLLKDESDLLEEIFFMEEKKIILTENGLINSDRFEDWSYQNEIISKLRYYDFISINVDDQMLLSDKKNMFKGIIPNQDIAEFSESKLEESI